MNFNSDTAAQKNAIPENAIEELQKEPSDRDERKVNVSVGGGEGAIPASGVWAAGEAEHTAAGECGL